MDVCSEDEDTVAEEAHIITDLCWGEGGSDAGYPSFPFVSHYRGGNDRSSFASEDFAPALSCAVTSELHLKLD